MNNTKYSVSGTYDKHNGLALTYMASLQNKQKPVKYDKQDVAEHHIKMNDELKDIERYK